MSELHDLGKEYGTGKFGVVERDLEVFLIRNREEILRFKATLARKNPAVTDEVAVKWYLLQLRTLNPVAEIRDQLREIEEECWIRAEKAGGGISRDEVAREWCARHAPGWRDHRVMAIIYCFERCKERLLPLLANPQLSEPR